MHEFLNLCWHSWNTFSFWHAFWQMFDRTHSNVQKTLFAQIFARKSGSLWLPVCCSNNLWQYRLWSFKGRDTKLERFLVKNKLQSNKIIKLWELDQCTLLYRLLDGKKTTRSQFSVPGLQEIHRNLKQEKKFNSRESFFRKSPFCTFSCINPGFGGPWDKLWIFFLIPIFIMPQKNAFGQKKFWISCTGSKVPFWQNWKIAKMVLLSPWLEFENSFSQKTYNNEIVHFFF